ncbi:flavanone 7-O-glucoside 2''-O-beta-L-rhamnosyltransferase-like [Coffea eugenioides]|uniref:flavanone 7-O-glucoside 2''-O-beta-L-rhamnosyltransferase-like n=1 Tax=Coffea eugenioides TaxID=49369 RepID=UPI000F608909|nr:flavanone 7-O-glucoside 2''-O-beta-L-rhamnosyltransferase-like [Coffea eugenioides]
MDSKEDVIRILMLPWLAHGHVSPFLELAKKLTSRNSNFQVYICSTPVNLSPFRENLAVKYELSSSIQFIDILLPSTSELPSEYHSTKNLPPHLMPALKTAFDGGKDCFLDILKDLKPHLLIYDFLQPWAPAAAQEENNIPSVHFMSCSASIGAFLFHCTEYPDLDYPIPELNFPKITRQELVQFMYNVSNGLTNKERYSQCIEKSTNFFLVKTLSEIEQKHMDYFSEMTKKEVIPVGPLVQEPENRSSDMVFLEWLSKRGPSSVVFVSFGTEYFLSKEEIEVIASGLELSMVSFIWVVRFHGRENVTSLQEVLPEGFQQRVAERGMVVEGWAPQVKILSHPSIGGFASHCGWSSTLESLAFGVPIIAMPMHLDQPLTSRLVAELGVGIEVRRENGKFREEEIARVIKQVVLQEEGKEVRKKVRELSNKIKEKGDQEIDHVVEKLLQLVKE